MTSWREVINAEGQTYYYDEINKESTWDKPAVYKRADEVSDGEREENAEGQEEEEEVGEAPRWCRAFDEAQEVYYYHTGTNEVTRARPEGFIDDDEGVNEGYAIEEATYDDRGDAASEDGEVADEADGSIEGSENMVAGVAAAAPTSADTLKPTTTEAASPPAAPVVDPLALAIAKLDEPDAIMELDVADTNMKAMQLGGDPAEMISKLFEGYQVSSSLVVAGFNLKFI